MPAAERRRDKLATLLIEHEHDSGDLAELLAQALSKALTELRAEGGA